MHYRFFKRSLEALKVKLKDIATIATGVTFRSRLSPIFDGRMKVIQMKDLGKDNIANLASTIRIESLKYSPKQVVELGDILFRSRGQVTTAALLDVQCSNVIVAAPLFKIRPDQSKVIPDYLLWAINQPSSQAYFASQAEGTMIKMVSKQSLEKLTIDLPSVNKQKIISKIGALASRERELLERIREKRFNQLQRKLQKISLEETNESYNN